MLAFRIADGRFPLLDGAGARALGGRWNSPGRAVVYASESFALALLEVLAHANLGRVPKTQVAIRLEIPGSVKIERLDGAELPGWDAEDQLASRGFGDAWLRERRTAALVVPSLLTCGYECNVILNPEHPGFAKVTAGKPEAVRWDERLLASGSAAAAGRSGGRSR